MILINLFVCKQETISPSLFRPGPCLPTMQHNRVKLQNKMQHIQNEMKWNYNSHGCVWSKEKKEEKKPKIFFFLIWIFWGGVASLRFCFWFNQNTSRKNETGELAYYYNYLATSYIVQSTSLLFIITILFIYIYF